MTRNPKGGASTIEMQLVRTVTGRYEKTVSRKLFEIFTAICLQRKFSKLTILRVYLEIAYFGTGLKGIKEGACALFPDKFPDIWDVDFTILTKYEAAQLASLLVYPKPRVINPNWQAKITRRANYGCSLYLVRKKLLKQIKG